MVAGRLRSASIGCDRDCPSLAGSPRLPSAEAAGGAASPNAGGLIMPSASDAVARAARLLQSRGGSGSCDAGLQAAAAGHLEQVAPRASIDALSDELLRGCPKARACLPPPGVAGEPATSVEGRTCSDPASMVARTVSDQKGRANGGRAGAGQPGRPPRGLLVFLLALHYSPSNFQEVARLKLLQFTCALHGSHHHALQ